MFAGLVEDEGDPLIEEKAPVGDADSGAIAAAPHESVSGLLERGRASGEINAWLGEVPYADFIGVREDRDEHGRRFVLETRPHNVGNPMLPALHGGVVSAFLETAAALDTLAQTREPRLPRLVNVTVDYLSSAGVKPTFARCRLVREGRRMANVEAWAWQDDEDAPVARARLTYVLGAPA
ncbi:MAG: PaaI family thioesterase [Halomonas sp.]|nr:PaaI family thioesterase [Gammaproteobacteria bacterium]MBR9880697.1 PaaI family thioesterase [Gammaproteobacteria bacterium]MBS8270906.1 PaaI family thioesterase [Halomonas litopenaei]NQY73003.1 PaaI family thioesterase [Halomonas sp.]RQW72219.1 PaaI family thioesterase [Halomonas sp. YLB-10]